MRFILSICFLLCLCWPVLAQTITGKVVAELNAAPEIVARYTKPPHG